jgi:hypothetical protein
MNHKNEMMIDGHYERGRAGEQDFYCRKCAKLLRYSRPEAHSFFIHSLKIEVSCAFYSASDFIKKKKLFLLLKKYKTN